MCFSYYHLVSVDIGKNLIVVFGIYLVPLYKENMLPWYFIYIYYIYLIRLIVINLQCFKVLECLGLPCINAPGEAEAYCAWLDKNGVSNQTRRLSYGDLMECINPMNCFSHIRNKCLSSGKILQNMQQIC